MSTLRWRVLSGERKNGPFRTLGGWGPVPGPSLRHRIQGADTMAKRRGLSLGEAERPRNEIQVDGERFTTKYNEAAMTETISGREDYALRSLDGPSIAL